ncbi:hypothetical protein BDZ89DRAFT_1115344 [Hymenopellis radicata]|nr:hypothetical protein BDZ89DRAFT_1115344 [Hymenopellis radicata]
MSLWRIPFTFSAAYCMYVSLTPPNAPPLAAERKAIKNVFDSEYFNRYVIISLKTAFSSMFIFDTIAILHLFPARWSTLQPPATCQMRVSWSFIAAWTLVKAGILLRVACYRILARFFTFELAIRKDHRLITYRTLTSGTRVTWGELWFKCVRVMYISRMKKEDEMLREAFGEQWENWRRDVPYRMIPKVY